MTTSRPLTTHEGNLRLRNTYSHHGNVGWQRDNLNRSWHYVSLHYRYTHNAVAMSQLYDTATGRRTFRPHNLSGQWDADAEYCFGNIPLDRRKHLLLTLAPHFQYTHSVDLTGTDRLERSTVRTARLYPRLRLDYRLGKHSLRLETRPDVRWLHSPRPDFRDFHVADIQTTLEAVLALPWKLQLATDLTLWNRRGYSSSGTDAEADASGASAGANSTGSLTTSENQWIWKARLSRSFLQGRLSVMLDGFDLLGQLRHFNRTLDAQGRTETWTSTPPRYLLLHVQWKFSKQGVGNAKK